MIPITSSLIKWILNAFHTNDLMEKMKISDEKYRYSVAWIDSMHKSFRGVLTCGNHFSKKILRMIVIIKGYHIILDLKLKSQIISQEAF